MALTLPASLPNTYKLNLPIVCRHCGEVNTRYEYINAMDLPHITLTLPGGLFNITLSPVHPYPSCHTQTQLERKNRNRIECTKRLPTLPAPRPPARPFPRRAAQLKMTNRVITLPLRPWTAAGTIVEVLSPPRRCGRELVQKEIDR